MSTSLNLAIPLTYDEAYANAKALFLEGAPIREANYDRDEPDELANALWSEVDNALVEFYPAAEFDMTWCMRILWSKPGLSEEAFEQTSGGQSIEHFIMDTIRAKLRADLDKEFRPYIKQKNDEAESLKAPTL